MTLISVSFAISILTYHLLHRLQIYDHLTLRLVFKRLLFYLPPTTEALKAASGITRPKNKEAGNRRHRRGHDVQANDSFQVPKDIDIDLHRTALGVDVISALRYYVELKWLMNVGTTATIAYLVTEIYYSTKDLASGAATNTSRQVETNFSLLWCIVTTFLCVLILGRLVHLYYSATERGEFFLVLLVGMLGATVSMVLLAFNDKTLDFGLKDAHKNFTEKFSKIPSVSEFARTVNFSYFGFGLLIGVLSGSATALFAFPGIRFGKMFRDARQSAMNDRNQSTVLLYSVSFGLPAVVGTLWMPTIQQSFWRENSYLTFNGFRVMIILATVALRMITLRGFLQAHLDSAARSLKALHKEPGRIEAEKLQFLLAAPSRYVGVVAVQYVAPLIMLTMLCFLYMSADLESFFPVRGNWTYNRLFTWLGLSQDYTKTVFEIHNAVWSVFTGALLKALFGYLTWWILISHFCFSLFAYYALHDH